MRCFGDGIELYEAYHDTEWGRPQRSEEALYEKICLEGLQSGLSWITVLRKREALREVFHGFDPEYVAGMDITPLLTDARLIRSRMKLQACVTNARATLAMEGELSDLIWSYRVDRRAPASWNEVPPLTEGSTELSKALKRKGFVFVGPTTVYSLMQALGIVNDHLRACPVRHDVETERQQED
ncbi:MAG: DNA-3-methyladenine glycosylase [Frankiales bacterium]|nr:DNA-3-methyladenine glycosylase [Frankiales bacterium]